MMGENRKKGFWLDPRAKLFLILMCVLASMVAPSLGYQFILVLLIALLGVLFGKWKYAVNAVCFYAVICVLTVWIMTEIHCVYDEKATDNNDDCKQCRKNQHHKAFTES